MFARQMDGSPDGAILAASARSVGLFQPHAGGWIFRLDRPDAPLCLDRGQDVGSIAVSPDGHWAATCLHNVGTVKVWDARDGRPVKVLVARGGFFPRFSPDGRWLAVGGDAGQLYAVGTWEPGLRFRGRAQFAPEGRLLAVNTGKGVLQLIDIAQERVLAALEGPEQAPIEFHAFAPDGARLITIIYGKEGNINVWDLRAIRRQLKALDLDWDAPDYPPKPAPADTSLRLEIVPAQ
jgi:WD40 repeat protein